MRNAAGQFFIFDRRAEAPVAIVLRKQAPEEREIAGCDSLGRETEPSLPEHSPEYAGIGIRTRYLRRRPGDAIGNRGRRGAEIAGGEMVDDVRLAAARSRHRHATVGLRFDQSARQCLIARRRHKDVGLFIDLADSIAAMDHSQMTRRDEEAFERFPVFHTAESDQFNPLGQLRIFTAENPGGLDQRREIFHRIIQTRSAEKNSYRIAVPFYPPIARTGGKGKGVGNNRQGELPADKRGFPRPIGQPVGNGHEMDLAGAGIELMLALPGRHGKRFHRPFPRKQRAVGAARKIAGAFSRMMADAGEIPHVVHRPDHRLPHFHDFPDLPEREHPLVDPVEADHVGALHVGMAVKGKSGGCRVDLEEGVAAQTVAQEDAETFGEEGNLYPPLRGGEIDKSGVGELLDHQHPGIGAPVAKSIRKPE